VAVSQLPTQIKLYSRIGFFHSVTHEVHTLEEHFKKELNLSPKDIESIIQKENGDIFFSANKKVYQ
jgi:hypothetical protein